MRNFLALVTLFNLVLPGICLLCYYGAVDDNEVEPDEDWYYTCESAEEEGVGIESCTASCKGPNSACFKVRFEGDDDFVSLYGCVDDLYAPTSSGSQIPQGYDLSSLDLGQLPDWDEEECEEDDEYNFNDQWDGGDLGGGDIEATWCTCVENECNGATTMASSSSFGVLLAVAPAAAAIVRL